MAVWLSGDARKGQSLRQRFRQAGIDNIEA
jgi:hypothetical protein